MNKLKASSKFEYNYLMDKFLVILLIIEKLIINAIYKILVLTWVLHYVFMGIKYVSNKKIIMDFTRN